MGACKWGFDEDLVRAIAANESWWRQSAHGDVVYSSNLCPSGAVFTGSGCALSYGIMQVKATDFGYTADSEPYRQARSALSVLRCTPAAKPMTTIETVIHRTPSSSAVPEPPPRDPELQAKIDVAIAACEPVKVPKSLSNPHSIIRGWMDEDRLARERPRGSIYAPIHISITRTQTDRRRL
jgi:hypothetical protein